MNDATPLAGKVAVVTGASRGIGKQTALELGALGASVVIAARTETPREGTPGTLADTVEEVRATGADVLAVPTDLSKADDVDRLIETVLAARGGVDILVNNAAYTVGRALWAQVPNLSREQWDKGVAVNCTAPLMLMQGYWESMRSRGGGVVVNVTSGASALEALGGPAVRLQGSDLPDNGPLYGATKAALDRMSNVIAHEGAADRIAVILLNPGGVLTETMALTLGDEAIDEVRGFMRPPSVPAKAIAHLCSCDDPMSYSGTIVNGPALHDELGL